jgi:hypothetical protein
VQVNRTLRGFLVHDVALDETNLAPNTAAALTSSYTQAEPKPGAATPADTRSTYLVQSSFAQDAELAVRVARPGVPEMDGGSVLYKESSEADTAYRGWCEPNYVTLYRPISWTTTRDWVSVGVVTIPSTQKLVAVGADANAVSPANTSWIWDPATRDWTSSSVGASESYELAAIGILRRTERVIALFADSGGEGEVLYTDDAGTTWALLSEEDGAIDLTAAAAADRMQLVEDRYGAFLLILTDDATGDWWLYRSGDGGGSFQATDSGTAWGFNHSAVFMPDGRICVVYREFTSLDAKSILLEDAYDTIEGKTGTAIDGTNNVAFVEVVVDDDGIVYALLRTEASDILKVARSTDYATSWTVYTYPAIGYGAATTRANHRVRPRAAAFSGGELVLLFSPQQVATSPATDGSLVSVVLGGWSNVEPYAVAKPRTRATRPSFGGSLSGGVDDASVIFPSEILANQGWAASGGAETLLSGYHRFNTAAATSSAELTCTFVDDRYTVYFEALVAAGGGGGEQAVYQVSRQTGGDGWQVQVRMSTAGFLLYDNVAGAQVGSSVTTSMTEVMQFLLAYTEVDTVTLFYKRPSATLWTKGPQTAALSSALAGATEITHTVGVLQNSTTDVRFGMIAFGDHGISTGLVADTSGADRFTEALYQGKALGGRPYPVRDQGYAGRVLRLAATGGPSRLAESLTLEVDHEYPARHLLPQVHPSPASGWRSTSTAEQIFAWDVGADSRLLAGWAVALALVGANFRSAVLEARDNAAGAWTTVGSWDALLLNGSFVRSGEIVTPTSTTGHYVGAGQLVGGTAILDPAGTPKARRIRWNSGGSWTTAGAPLVLHLDGIDGTELTTGDLRIIAPAGVLVVHDRRVAARYWRVRIPASQSVAESYYELGQLVLGGVWAMGRQWSRGWSERDDPRAEVEEDDYGTLWVRRRRPRRRELTVSWQDGHDLSKLYASGDPPWLGTPTTPLVADQDVWWQLTGMLEAARGGELAAVALKEIPSTTGMVLDPRQFLYGTLAGSTVQWNDVQGDEGRSSVGRIESVTLVEQV